MATKTKAAKSNRPVHELRLGRIKGLVWRNETEVGVRYSVTLSRLYLDKDETWQTTTSFGRDDLPLVAKVADQLHTWIFEQSSQEAEAPAEAA